MFTNLFFNGRIFKYTFLCEFLAKLSANVPPALCSGGFPLTEHYKYTEKIERKK